MSATQSAGTRASFQGEEVYPLVIGGREVATAESFASIDPSTGEAWTRVGEATRAEVEAAVAAARVGLPWLARDLARDPAGDARRLADAIEAAPRLAEPARHRERPADPRGAHRRRADRGRRAALLRRPRPRARGRDGAAGSRDSLVWTMREPLGVIAALIPWNSPLISTALKVAPALAAGNTIVLKPSEFASPSVVEFARIASGTCVPAA